MYIHEVIIDGFKSYATRTVVSGFDPHFNAITGLNGTGKSNILDAICFVLGISNLSQVRVGNLQELVYKQGQAGVTKATVSIVFNNADPLGSPVGYETSKEITVSRQIIIGGKNKYTINGRTVQRDDIQTLFHSVQLNVDNPHFLIMQGRITKVLNMKPIEILSMIEEAAGTRMFETKKQSALKTIAKKQQKVDEITVRIDNDIAPSLLHLREDREQYQEYMHSGHEIDRINRTCIAYEYSNLSNECETAEAKREEMRLQLNDLSAIESSKTLEATEMQKSIDELRHELCSELEGTLSAMKDGAEEISKELVRADTNAKNQKETAASEKSLADKLGKQLLVARDTLVEKTSQLSTVSTQFALKEEELSIAETEMIRQRERYQNACAGIADESSAELLSIPEQIGAWEKRQRETASQIQQTSIRLDHGKKSMAEKKRCTGAEKAEYDSAMKEVNKLRSAAAAAELKAREAGSNSADEEGLRRSLVVLKQNHMGVRDTVDALSAQLEARLNFEYKDPVKGFDRSRVKGMVARLVRLPDARAATALEVTAGGKLFQVVVDSEQTGKLLLDNGQLKKRVTILPLNKLSSRCVDSAKINLAKATASRMGGAAYLALELVHFNEDVRKAMEYVFGSTIICDSSAIAKAIAFDPKIATKTVTLEGDVYDPSGTLTGGSSTQLGTTLIKLFELSSAEETLSALSIELNASQNKLKDAEMRSAAARASIEAYQSAQHILQITEEKIKDSKYAQMQTEQEELEASVTAFEKELVDLKEANRKATQELKQLQNTADNVTKKRENAMKEMENAAKAAQKVVTNLKASMSTLKHSKDVLSAEVESIEKEIVALTEQHGICEKGLGRLQEEIDSLLALVAKKKAEFAEAKSAIEERQKELTRCSKELKQLEASKEKCMKEVEEAGVNHRAVSNKLKDWEKRCKDNSIKMKALTDTYHWIATEKEYFGQQGSEYDFASKDMTKAKEQLDRLKSDHEKLAKRVNPKVVSSIEKVESESAELMRKKQVILNDKKKIEDVISELDIKKTQALENTWVKVNKDFGSIFSTLLPGTTAKLEPLPGCSVMDGLEVKVAFNNVWKEGLTELSGGQRSLLALSLILSMLLFKPAPMYILDEVDAALDLSHTQNIGIMLRAHFSASQFIVVSLKEGMFNNANVIFRTRFVDGVSAVMRTVVGGRSKALESRGDEENIRKETGKTKGKSRKEIAA